MVQPRSMDLEGAVVLDLWSDWHLRFSAELGDEGGPGDHAAGRDDKVARHELLC